PIIPKGKKPLKKIIEAISETGTARYRGPTEGKQARIQFFKTIHRHGKAGIMDGLQSVFLHHTQAK
ncbi:hypothetical protein, partial [Parafilimonas sp.]|uniref:hypothetical protein n=1 Tax=Parafilimonas sp. TaxID=1969739 RepID=UPI0039E37917